jgi:hypothetical protein
MPRLSSSLIVSAVEVRRLRKDCPSVTQQATVVFLSEMPNVSQNIQKYNFARLIRA